MFFTHSHKIAHDTLTVLGQLFYSGQCDFRLIKPRLYALIAGPTGSGKSHLVEQVAQELDAEYFKVTRGDWLPQGVKTGRATVYQIIDRVWSRGRVLLHIDELDKFQIDFRAGDWGAGVCSDLWNVLDLKFNFDEYLRDSNFGEQAKPTANELREKISSQLWIVGSGTWQDVFSKNRKGAKLGFSGSAEESVVGAHEIAHSGLISAELLHRFNSDLLFLTYPTQDETAGILEQTGLSAMAQQLGVRLPTTIDWNQGGFRALETIATRLSIDLYRRKQMKEVAAPVVVTKPARKLARSLAQNE